MFLYLCVILFTWDTMGYGQQAGGTHPTGIHSCYCNEVVAKVIFLHLSVILFTGGGVSEADPPGRHTPRQVPPSRQARHPPAGTPRQVHPPGRYTPQAGTPAQTTHTPPGSHPLGRYTPPPPGAGTPPQAGTPSPEAHTPPGRRCQHTVNERPVCILLECILV